MHGKACLVLVCRRLREGGQGRFVTSSSSSSSSQALCLGKRSPGHSAQGHVPLSCFGGVQDSGDLPRAFTISF